MGVCRGRRSAVYRHPWLRRDHHHRNHHYNDHDDHYHDDHHNHDQYDHYHRVDHDDGGTDHHDDHDEHHDHDMTWWVLCLLVGCGGPYGGPAGGTTTTTTLPCCDVHQPSGTLCTCEGDCAMHWPCTSTSSTTTTLPDMDEP